MSLSLLLYTGSNMSVVKAAQSGHKDSPMNCTRTGLAWMSWKPDADDACPVWASTCQYSAAVMSSPAIAASVQALRWKAGMLYISTREVAVLAPCAAPSSRQVIYLTAALVR